MQRVAVLSLALLYGMSVMAKADPVVILGTYSMTPNGTLSIPVYVQNSVTSGLLGGSGQVNPVIPGLDLNVSIQNAAGVDGGAGAPHFVLGTAGLGAAINSGYVGPLSGAGTGADPITGTIFSQAGVTHSVPNDGGNSTSQNIQLGLQTTGGSPTASNLANTTLLARLYLATTNATPGSSWYLVISTANNAAGYAGGGPDNGDTDFGDAGLANPFNTSLTGGLINVVPEPASIVMGMFAAAGLAAVAIRRKRHA